MSGISGFRATETSEYATEDIEAPAATSTEGTEATIDRGAVPTGTAEVITQMDASVLQDRLMDQGLSTTEAAVAATEIQATAEEVSDLEKELASLLELEAMYEEMLADPFLDEWDAWWIESDLWDVRLDRYEIEDQLGKLEGELETLVGGAWGGLLGALEKGVQSIGIAGQRQNDLDGLFERDRAGARRTQEDLARAQRDKERLMEQLREKGLVIPIPPKSEVGKKLAAELSKKIGEARGRMGDDIRAGFQDVKRKLIEAGAAAAKAPARPATQASGKQAALAAKSPAKPAPHGAARPPSAQAAAQAQTAAQAQERAEADRAAAERKASQEAVLGLKKPLSGK